MYGSSNDFVGVIIGIIVGAIVLFFICRELICWYYKINRIVSLLEENNRLLRIQTPFIPTHIVKLLTNADGLSLRENPNASGEVLVKLKNETKVQFIEKGNEVELNETKGSWFRIRTQDGNEGWCFSGSLEKI